MSDIGKAFREFQRQDIERLKIIREKHKKEDDIIFKIVVIGFVIFNVFIIYLNV